MEERTFIILKPDCMKKNLAGAVIDRFAKAGFRMVACKMIQLDEAILRIHYDFLIDKPFFKDIVEYMISSPVVVMVLAGNNVIASVRELLGPTDSKLAPKGTIRGDFGLDKSQNIAHASDSIESANKEISRFFQKNEIF